jgi:hypothetical protein
MHIALLKWFEGSRTIYSARSRAGPGLAIVVCSCVVVRVDRGIAARAALGDLLSSQRSDVAHHSL